MKNETNYKITGKRWKLNILKSTLFSVSIPCYHNETAGFLLVTTKNLGELKILQTACNTLGLKYHQQ